jgi:hypothetical protein
MKPVSLQLDGIGDSRSNLTPHGRCCPSGDLSAGDVIALPGEDGELVVVRAVRLGHGGFLLTVSALKSPSPAPERIITLAARTRVLRHGKGAAF